MKNRTTALLILGISVLIITVIGSAFAFFSGVDLNTTQISDFSGETGGATSISLITVGDALNLSVDSIDMLSSNISSEAVTSDEGTLEVRLTAGTPEVPIECEYDIYYAYTTDNTTTNYVRSSATLNEFTYQINKNNTNYISETNYVNTTSTPQKLGTEKIISYGTEVIDTFTITSKFYNIDANQTHNSSGNFKIRYYVEADRGKCVGYSTLSGTLLDNDGNPLVNQAIVAFSDPVYFTTDENGHYNVTLKQGDHTIYFVPGMSMADLQSAGESIKTHANKVSQGIRTSSNENIRVNSYAARTISITCDNCSSDFTFKQVPKGSNVSFVLTALEDFNLTGATVTGGCSLVGNTLTFNNLQENTVCNIVAKPLSIALTEAITRDNSVSTRSSFSSTLTSNTTGTVYSTNSTDDGSTVYYYAGNTTNNWVVFGNNGSTYYYWRIIRTNSTEEGGGVRLLYSGSGTSATSISGGLTNGIAISSQKYYSSAGGPSYVGYMFTNNSQHAHGTSSTVKTQLESWYTSSGLSNFESKINKDAVYCNDRSTNGTFVTTGAAFDYAGKLRLESSSSPTYKCGGNTSGDYYETAANRLEDKFSATTNGGGNGYLSKPIAMMTADEIVFAGGVYNATLSSPYAWYYTNGNGSSITGTTAWWTLTPYVFYSKKSTYGSSYSSKTARVFYVTSGKLAYNSASTAAGIRPVISLLNSVKVKGTGTISDPYIVQ